MLAFERHIVAELTTTADRERRAAVADFVDGSLRDMPEHLRAAIAAASIALGLAATITGGRGMHVHQLDMNPVAQIRQYARLFRSLVLFAEQELPAATTRAA